MPARTSGRRKVSPPGSATVNAGNGLFTLLGFMGLYALLAILFLFLMHREIAHGPAETHGAEIESGAPVTTA